MEYPDERTKGHGALGVSKLTVLAVESGEDANDTEVVAALEDATRMDFTADQLRIASISDGSRADTALHARFHDGLVIGRTIAGAAMMSTTMILLGGKDPVPTAGSIRTGACLGLLNGVTIDRHFAERGRLIRLLAVKECFPTNSASAPTKTPQR